MKKIVCIVGARPQFIKHFPLEIELKKLLKVVTVHTGQHYDEKMSDVFFNELNISRPSYQFSLSKTNHGGQTGEMLELIENVLLKEKPAATLVYGDTNSTIAGALASAKLNIPVVHVEAGLRSRNMTMPEEINRILTDHISSLLFCSSEVGVTNLRTEGITKGVHMCGDLMKDALKILSPKLERPLKEEYVFATFHRPYNTDDYGRLESIISVLRDLPYKVVFPVHPRTRKTLVENGMNFSGYPSIEFIEPVGYIDSLRYQKFSQHIITDSGGIQKEAYWLKKKCLTVRTETEWVETLSDNWNRLVFDDLQSLKSNTYEPSAESYDDTLYGDGFSAKAITEALVKNLIGGPIITTASTVEK